MTTPPIRPGTARRLGLRRGVPRRMYTLEQEPPLGERVTLVNGHGAIVVWTGRRWHDPWDANGSLQTQDAWPPDPYVYGSSVWREVS